MTKSAIEKIGVVGSGQMGRGIAQVAISFGFEVVLFDASREALKTGENFIENQWAKGIEKKKWDHQFVQEAKKRLKASHQIADLSSCHLVIEAATENKKIKLEIFKALDEVCQNSCLLVSNTSSLSITELAARTKRPEQFMGMHFMNPVPVMKLVEGIRGLGTSDETAAKVREVAERMGKTYVEVRDVPGFAVNRILMPMINEAIFALYEGIATSEDLDLAMKLGTNVPMGPLELADFIGLDTCLSIMEVLHTGLGESKYRPCPLLRQYVAAGWLGRKSGKGFYEYK